MDYDAMVDDCLIIFESDSIDDGGDDGSDDGGWCKIVIQMYVYLLMVVI